jgi:hypothetical protein
VAPGLYTGPGNYDLNIASDSLTLLAPAGPWLTIVDGTGAEEFDDLWARVSGANDVIDGFTVRNFNAFSALALFHEDAVTIANCRFLDNTGFTAGAVFWGDAAPVGTATLANCIFARNSADFGGAVWHQSYGNTLRVFSSTFVDNQGGVADALAVAQVEVFNSIFRGRPNQIAAYHESSPVGHSNVQGPLLNYAYDAGGNIDADPLFADPAADHYRLLGGSPCIDAADNTTVPEWLTADIAGLPRFIDDPQTADTGVGPPPIVDMGAHEFQLAPCYPDFDPNGSLDLFDFLAFVNAFNAGDPTADCDGSAALDLFDFLCFVNAFNEGC